MFCKKCGTEVEEGWTACPNCGEKVEESKTTEVGKEKLTKKKKPFYKRWWFIVIAAFAAFFIFINAGDDEETNTLDSDNNTENSESEEVDAEYAEETNTSNEDTNTESNESEEESDTEYTMAELYSLMQDNDVAPYEMSEKAKQFLTEHEDCFPAANYEHIEGLVDTSIEYRFIEKSPAEYGDKLLEVPGLYVMSISEDDIGTSNKFTEIQATDEQDNVYRIFYNGSLDVFKEDIIRADVLPLGLTSYDNVSGGTTNALVVAGSYIEKIDSLVE